MESYILLTKLNDGSIADWFEPSLIMDRKYPGTSNMTKKNATTPNAAIYLLLAINPIGIIAIKTNNKHKTGNFLMFLNGYLKEFKTILDKSIICSPNMSG